MPALRSVLFKIPANGGAKRDDPNLLGASELGASGRRSLVPVVTDDMTPRIAVDDTERTTRVISNAEACVDDQIRRRARRS